MGKARELSELGGTVTVSNGNVGIGGSPSAWYSTQYRGVQFQDGWAVFANDNGNGAAIVASNAYGSGANEFKYINSNYATMYQQGLPGGSHRWYVAPSGTAGNAITFTQAMTLDGNGNLLVGKTSSADTVVGSMVRGTGYITATWAETANSTTTYHVYSTGASAYRFYVGLGGTVYATNTAISAISDRRFKENIRDLDSGLDAILELKPRVFDWKAGKGKDIKNDRGFIADEFKQVFPDLIDEWKDTPPEGEAPYESVRPELMPVLVRAIQELKAELDTVKAELAALKG